MAVAGKRKLPKEHSAQTARGFRNQAAESQVNFMEKCSKNKTRKKKSPRRILGDFYVWLKNEADTVIPLLVPFPCQMGSAGSLQVPSAFQAGGGYIAPWCSALRGREVPAIRQNLLCASNSLKDSGY